MRVTTPEQAEILNRLAALAEGDIELVQRAIRASSEGQKPAEVEKVARYILTEMARRKAEARRSVANVA